MSYFQLIAQGDAVSRLVALLLLGMSVASWVVERTFAWLGRYRRLSKDYEYLCQTSENWIYVAMSHLLVRRLARMRAF